MPQALVLMHVPFEGPAMIKDWLRQQRIDCEEKHVPQITHWQALPLPDWLIIMGGPMSVNDSDTHRWLDDEIAFIKRAIDASVKVVGVCLGAQLIAKSLGAAITPNAEREIGWFEISATAAAKQHPLGALLSTPAQVLHWHGDTFELPAGAVHLAASRACRHQIFAYGDNVLGLQCHLEMGPAQAARLAQECAEEVAAGGHYVQSAADIIAAEQPFDSAQRLMGQLLSALQTNCAQP